MAICMLVRSVYMYLKKIIRYRPFDYCLKVDNLNGTLKLLCVQAKRLDRCVSICDQ
jgi:hypothetical protein